MKTRKLSGKGIKKKNLTEELLDNFEEDKIADSKNITNEKQLNNVINKVIRHTKKMALKPINTHQLLKQ